MSDKNPLEEYFFNNDKRLIHKWLHYFDIYHKFFQPFRGKKITVVEFGVSHGGSLQMWKEYFGENAMIYGIDIDPRCKAMEEDRVKVLIGDQADRKFLKSVRKQVGQIDILIEDGGHRMDQQIATFEELYPAIKEGGVFLIEDLHTSYWPEYGGGYKRPGTFTEYSKNLIDQINAWHSIYGSGLRVDEYTKSIKGIHVYDSIIVFEKGAVKKPTHQQIGKPSF